MSLLATNDEPTAELPRFLTALPVYNECRHVTEVLDEVVKYATDVLVVQNVGAIIRQYAGNSSLTESQQCGRGQNAFEN